MNAFKAFFSKRLQRLAAKWSGYPQPIPILTATVVAFAKDNPYRVLLVQKRNTKKWVFPGGIYNIEAHGNRLETARQELEEETGLKPESELWTWAELNKPKLDQREWKGFKTDHCSDLLCACVANGDPKPNDTNEILNAYRFDLSAFDLSSLGLGHSIIAELWLAAVMSGDYNHKNKVYT